MNQWLSSWALLRRRCLGVITSAFLLVACGGGGGDGGGGGGGGGTPPPPANAPVALRFDAIDPFIAPGGQLYLRVRAEYRDSTMAEVTSLASWNSTQPAVATVANTGATTTAGFVSGVTAGRTDIVVTYQGVTASLAVTVASGLLRRIEVSFPEAMAIGIGGQFRFGATAHYTDSSQFDDQSLTWTSSAPDVMTVSNQTGLRGTVTGVRPGKATITVSKDGISWSTELSVLNIRKLVGRPYGSAEPGPDTQATVRIDGSGRSLALFGYVPVGPARPAALIATRPAGDGVWSTPVSLVAGAVEVYARGRDIAMNESGQAIVVWQSENRLYVAHYSPADGMSEAQLLTDTSSLRFSVAIAADGSGLVTWERVGPDFMSQVAYSRFDAASGRWSAPAQVPGTELTRGGAEHWRMVMNEAGQGALLWRRRAPMAPSTMPGDESINALMVSRFEPGAAGWQSAELLQGGGGPGYFGDADLAIGGAGHVAAVWIQATGSTPAGAIVAHVRTRRHEPGTGWSSEQDVVSASPLSPTAPRMAINDSGAAVLAWQSGWDNGLWVAATQPDGSWGAARSPFTPDLSIGSGTPEVLRPAMTSDGRALVAWRLDILGIRSNLATARYTPQAGWENLAVVPFVGRNFTAYNIELHFNRAGRGTAIWSEGGGEGGSLYTSSDFQF